MDQPEPRFVDKHTLLDKPTIVAILGLPGSGKSSVKKTLIEVDDRFLNVINSTTRAPRVNDGVWEQHGTDYFFLTESDFKARLREREIINATTVGHSLYGTDIGQYTNAARNNRIAIVDFDTVGLLELRKTSIGSVHAFFLLPPNGKRWRAQFAARYPTQTEGDEAWATRADFARRELQRASNIKSIHFVINASVMETTNTIIRAVQLLDDPGPTPTEIRETIDELITYLNAST